MSGSFNSLRRRLLLDDQAVSEAFICHVSVNQPPTDVCAVLKAYFYNDIYNNLENYKVPHNQTQLRCEFESSNVIKTMFYSLLTHACLKYYT